MKREWHYAADVSLTLIKEKHSMRKQPTVKKPASTLKASQPQMRNLISAHPTKKLSDLVIQAKAPLEEALSKAHLPADKVLILFFSFTDGLQRATVVQFSGKHLTEVWKKLADWQQRTFKQSPTVRWLRIDWVTEKRAMPWADCLTEMQNVKRNYFRYGVSLDANFRYAFLEQELNANAMLYLGVKQPKAALNKKNFLNYGVKRYGKHFSLPSRHDQALLFTTQAILVQLDKPHKQLHGYSGGIEGRNTGRRIIEQLDSPQVEALIQQSSQFLAEQVDATGRFIYGIHPCFDRDIKAYNTLRHTSTTYSMLEAWEVTQSAELKAAIDRSITHLTSELIRQYALPSGETLAYLQDSNNEIKLGGNAVCLLALVKYTELTNDSQYLPLMEQLALGIQRMQNQQNGQLYHVLNADDLSIKEEFRIIYYDGEAAFGLMRLYGLTNDERWLHTVEKAFEYFIEKDHWKIHDHWLSYCVNELTIYRPEERYYQFGIKNVAGHLDFVIGRITTFPTLLELMMAAHKMITRLEASDQHRYLLEQIDLKKFYRALEARAHYLLNGFFWPELAIYFQNPQRIMGSFFIRHHSFRVRIDDVEHYLSGYIAYLLHYLRAPLENHQATNISTDKNEVTQVTGTDVIFLNQDIGKNLTGIEHSALGRASLFIEELGINPLIVTFQYRPELQRHVAQLLTTTRYHSATRIIGLYDFLQGFHDPVTHLSYQEKLRPPVTDPSFPNFKPMTVKGFKDVRYLTEQGALFAYKVYSKDHGALTHINYFENGRKVAADVYHSSGHRSSHRLIDPNSQEVTHEIYYSPWGIPLFFRAFKKTEPHTSTQNSLAPGFYLHASLTMEERFAQPIKQPTIAPHQPTIVTGREAIDNISNQCTFLGDSTDFSLYALNLLTAKLTCKRLLLLSDKNKFTFKPAVILRDTPIKPNKAKDVRVISLIHSTHYQGERPDGNIKTHYRDPLQSQYFADGVIALTQAQKLDIQNRFPDKKVMVVPHTLSSSHNSMHNIRNETRSIQAEKIVYVARLSPEKQHLMALEIFSTVLKQVPTARLHIYGEGSERSKIESRIKMLQLDNSVVLEGYCSDVSSIYQNAHCAILTSKMEGFSLSLLEAMAFRCPIVAFDINYGPGDLITSGESGFLVPYGDKEQFTQHLVDIIKQPSLAEGLGKNALEKFQKKFAPPQIAKLWQEVIVKSFK